MSEKSYNLNAPYFFDVGYSAIAEFVKADNNITYQQFDARILKKVNLFALPESFDFEALDKSLDMIIKTLPAIKSIFSKPITHITNLPEVLPVESVQVINNETIVHASVHSELWENITSDGIKPRKLLTKGNRDNYAIYENIMFARLIDTVLSFVDRNLRILNSILYANRDLKFNLLERENHIMYFLSIGKLHASYVRDYARYTSVAEKCIEKARFIERVVRARLSRPVYKNCHKFFGNLTLKKTNVFRVDKEYHKIYLLLKWFSERNVEIDAGSIPETSSCCEGYGHFCTLLSIFAAGHFNFTFPEYEKIDFVNTDTECTFDKWRLGIKTIACGELKVIEFSVSKDTVYKTLLLTAPNTEIGNRELAKLKESFNADEYLLVCPAEEDKAVYISLYDIDSFRRLQQIILRGMVYSDCTRDVCPFCGQPLERRYVKNGQHFECEYCRTQIKTEICPETDQQFEVTRIKNYAITDDVVSQSVKRVKRSFKHQNESLMHFRNITAIGSDAEPICPKCGRMHFE